MGKTALNRTSVQLLTNKSGGAVAQGDVVVIDTGNASSFTTTTTAGYSAQHIGVVVEPNGIANNASGLVATGGYVSIVNLDGAASIGDFIKTDTVAKQGTPHATPSVTGDFAQALTASVTPEAILFGTPNWATGGGGGGGTEVDACDGRLTLTSGIPVTTADVSAATTLYYTPYVSNQISLYDGASAWDIITFAEINITLVGLTASRLYDVFCYNNGGTATLELLIWTDDTNRATAIVYQEGRLVKSGDDTRRYLGTIYINSSGGQTEDTKIQRFVWNYYNRVTRNLFLEDLINHSYTTGAWRIWRNIATNLVEFILGIEEDLPKVNFSGQIAGLSAGIGLDTTASDVLALRIRYSLTSSNMRMGAGALNSPGIGFHYYAMVEYGKSSADGDYAKVNVDIRG